MRFQTTLEGAECLRRSDAGWQSVPGTRRSDEERVITNRRTTRRWCDMGRPANAYKGTEFQLSSSISFGDMRVVLK